MTTTKTKHAEIFNDIQQYAYVLQRDRYRTFDLHDIESEMMFWAAGRMDYLWEVKQADPNRYRKYLKVSLVNLLNAFIIPIQVRQTLNIGLGGGNFPEDLGTSTQSIIDYKGVDPVLTPSDIEYRLKRRDPGIFAKMENLLTENRYQILVEHYLEGKSIADVAADRGISRTAVYNHLKGAINLLTIRPD